jgi:hypothetical protein
MKLRKFQWYLKTLQPPCEVLIIQEHKLSGAKANELGRSIWPDAACYILDADLRYAHNIDGAGRGGVGILVSPYIKHMVASSGSLGDNKSIWVTFTGTPVGKLGILNVYTPNCSRERGRLWESLASTLDPFHA